MTAAAVRFGKRRHIHVTHRPQRHLDPALRHLPEEHRHPDARDRARKLDDALEIVHRHSVPFHRPGRNGHPAQPDVRLDDEGLQRFRQEPRPADGGVRVDVEIDRFRVESRLQQLRHDAERPRSGIAEAKPAGVRQDGDVERAGHLLRERPAIRERHFRHQLPGGRGGGIDIARPVGKRTRAHMVVDAGDRHAALGDRSGQHPEAAEIGDVEHDDDVGGAERLDRLRAAIDPRHIAKEKIEPGRRGCRIGDHRLDADFAEEQDQTGFAAEPVAVGIDVGGETDPPPRHQQLGECLGGGQLFSR